MGFVINGKDQPRVVFNYREPGKATRDRALTLTEERPFDISPQPTAEFFRNRSGCEVLRNPVGFTETANDDSGCEFHNLLGLFNHARYSTAHSFSV
jgi:hypothetical protein